MMEGDIFSRGHSFGRLVRDRCHRRALPSESSAPQAGEFMTIPVETHLDELGIYRLSLMLWNGRDSNARSPQETNVDAFGRVHVGSL